MKKIIPIKLILIAFISSIVCNSIWLFEVTQIKGWPGLNWLNGNMNSVFIIIPIIVLTFLYLINKNSVVKSKNLILSFSILTIISFLTYFLARDLLYSVFSRIVFLFETPNYFIRQLKLPFIFSLYTFGYFLTTKYLLQNISKKIILGFLSIPFLSVSLALVSIHLFKGFGSGGGFINSVKMGYPIFWFSFVLSCFGLFISTKKIEL